MREDTITGGEVTFLGRSFFAMEGRHAGRPAGRPA
jgi:hypothetical protein